MIQVQRGSPALVLAPMEGVTDAPMRALMTELGGFSYCVSEFLRVSQDVPPPHVFLRHIPELNHGARTPCGVPVQVQILGGDSEKVALAAAVAVQTGATAIDLNFGCPAPTVNRHDGGATLLKYPDRIRTIVQAVRQKLPAHVPVSAKLRLGWDDMNAIHLNAEMAAEGGAAWITIHARTKIQGYAPPAHWKPIGEVRRRLGIPVIANGDIWTLDDFKKCRDITGCEHYMLGRSALADPNLPGRISRELGIRNTTVDDEVNWSFLLPRFAELADSVGFRKSGYVPCRIKQWARMANQRNPIAWYDRIKPLQTREEIFRAILA